MPGRKPGARYANHPLVKFVRGLEGEYYLASEVADILGCAPSMLDFLRRRAKTPLGATHKAQYGAIVVHLYTPERVAEISDYLRSMRAQEAALGNKGGRGPVRLWNATEYQHRIRESTRARNYRVRAAGYRARGLEADAARMDDMAAALAAELAKDRAERWAKVHGAPPE